jgi:predicted AlkP superfamily pyrophosphatase or phosphodiesterase
MVFALCAIALGASACDTATPLSSPSATPRFDRVVLVSIDGLRADAVEHMPVLSQLRARAAWTDSLRTVVPALTVPGHLSMLSGRDVTRMGIRSNDIDTTAAILWYVNGASTVFDWVRGAGGSTEVVAGASLVSTSAREEAREFLGADRLVATALGSGPIGNEAVATVSGPGAPTLLFVHFPDVDLAGHDSGWIVPDARSTTGGDSLGSEYLAAAARVDAEVGRLAAALAPAIDSGRAALVITADHGGGYGEGCTAGVPAFREHCTATPGDDLIPLVIVGKGVPVGRLTTPLSITQVGPTVGRLLGVWMPAGIAAPIRF